MEWSASGHADGPRPSCHSTRMVRERRGMCARDSAKARERLAVSASASSMLTGPMEAAVPVQAARVAHPSPSVPVAS